MKGAALKPLLLALIFGAGMIAGGALVFAFRPDAPTPPPGARQLSMHWLAHLSYRLHLTPDQQAKIGPILADAANRLETLHRTEVGQGAVIMDAANAKIEPLLTPDQQAELQKIRTERQRVFSGHMHWEGGPPGRPGPPDGNFPHDNSPPPPPSP